ncbi:hypothetical protein COV23_00780 [Candidatus Wolfebacteria bacterium CG10_big_fil_rev_8_21_14_0_10_31_9]|uniref:Glycosyltransferase 2-like domain-containing protein n=1 Tax=Candidatus Wolfebacteria bacterium CG10_big_fil_rev_8_21_14_0_10_31_9 TaxID=1975070 RepID=A0A2H0RCQ3_9BACT|nr:MAG: hypothetical protein COV23_00780 [Candidatus Wolfebacteria bacterium CG10_big_fil_rev_8_21_14_0_10_31_9]
METSIIIRTRNEEKHLEVILKQLFDQTYKDFEIIIVDSGSSDRTLEIAKKFPVKIFEIPYKDFSYPYALNFGLEKSEAKKYIVILSARFVLISNTWLEDGLKNFNEYEKIMGVYGPTRAMPDAGFWDKFFLNYNRGLRMFTKEKNSKNLIFSGGIGVMGFTNAIILKDLYNKRKFNEEYGSGGEDGEWAGFWFEKGYRAVKDKAFTVCHSHYLGLLGWDKQWKHWASLGSPHKFNLKEFSFRKSNIFKL